MSAPRHRLIRLWQGAQPSRPVTKCGPAATGEFVQPEYWRVLDARQRRHVRRRWSLPIWAAAVLTGSLLFWLMVQHFSFTLLWLGPVLSSAILLGGHRLASGSLSERQWLADWERLNRSKPIWVPDVVRDALRDGETVSDSYREHPILIVKWVVLALLAQPPAIGLALWLGWWQVALAVSLLAAIGLGLRSVERYRTLWFITNQRVIKFNGRIQGESTLQLVGKATDCVHWWARALAWCGVIELPYGEFTLKSWQSSKRMMYAPDIDGLKKRIKQLTTT